MNNSHLNQLIDNFNIEHLTRFFKDIDHFRPLIEELQGGDQFKHAVKIGELAFESAEEMVVCAFEVDHPLTERSGKKMQFEKARQLLKDYQVDAGIFVFFDDSGAFRFSLVYSNYQGTKRDWSNFRRFTYYVNKELTNKTYLQQIGACDFRSLDKIKEAFSVEKVTKEFYRDIAYWYEWANLQVRFPKDAESEPNGRKIAVIRMITRIIFIWFMRVKGLIPDSLFNEQESKKKLSTWNMGESTYYQAILQNLFFATLSTKQEDRVFRSEARGIRGYNPDHGNKSVFRYQELFSHPENIQEYFEEIPFLNGGLFDCLDDYEKDLVIDGFSDIKKNQPLVPNRLFFSSDAQIDLNEEYGTKNAQYPVRGLFRTLSMYNFTIDENTVDDQDVALDPELLGRVFENLLASFNPETETTARKATGSYYTPREIVDYMVIESLKGYFRTHLEDIEGIDGKLRVLFSEDYKEKIFSDEQRKRIVGLVENLRLVDPAVGSGAYPMGALNQLVEVLHKVDPDNKLWEQKQVDAAEAIPDAKLKGEIKERIRVYFREKNPDYGRKLYLIQKCIYGVDIQQIAVEIAKLRFFISLLVDERVDPTANNWGVEPLPNLDFKIMQGNSLVSEFLGVKLEIKNESPTGQANFDFQDERSQLIKKFESKKIEYQNESDKIHKRKLLQEIDDAIIEIFILVVKQQKETYFNSIESIKRKYAVLPNIEEREYLIRNETEKINLSFNFDIRNAEKQLREYTGKLKVRPFFPWQLYFAEVFTEKEGFDIVIGNPPYVSAIENSKTGSNFRDLFRKQYPLLKGSFDLYVVFLLLGQRLTSMHGFYAWIIPNKFLISNYASSVKENLISNGLFSSVDVSFANVFDNGVYPIIIFGNKKIRNNFNQFNVKNLEDLKTNNLSIIEKPTKVYKTFFDFGIKINSGTTGFQAQSIVKLISETRQVNSIPFIVSGCVDPYLFTTNNVRYMGHYYKQAFIKKGKNIADSKWEFWKNPKIIIAGMTKRIEAVYSETPVALGVGIYGIYDFGEFLPKFLLGILNSRFISYYLVTKFIDKHLAGGYIAINKSTIEQLPLVSVDESKQKEVVKLVDRLMTVINTSDETEKIEIEREIDSLVYQFYGLTDSEISIIEMKE